MEQETFIIILMVLVIGYILSIKKWLYNKCWGNQVEPTEKNKKK